MVVDIHRLPVLFHEFVGDIHGLRAFSHEFYLRVVKKDCKSESEDDSGNAEKAIKKRRASIDSTVRASHKLTFQVT